MHSRGALAGWHIALEQYNNVANKSRPPHVYLIQVSWYGKSFDLWNIGYLAWI
jgi:hypothetical protein